MMQYFLVLLLLLCSAASSFADGKEFKIGFTLPLSGPFAEFGSAVKNAIEFVKEENPNLFKNTEIILEDDQYNAKNTVTAFQKLKDLDRCNLVIVWGNEPALAVAPLAENAHFPLLAFGQTPAIAAGRKNVVRILGPANEFGKPTGRYLKSQNATSVDLILVENTFYKLVADSIHAELPSSVAFNIIGSVPASETDFRTYLLKAKQSPSDFLGVILAPSQLLPFFRQANELHITNPIFGSTSFESEAAIKEGRQLMNGAVYSHVAVNSAWRDKYLSKFGDDIQVSYAAVAFDTMIAIGKIIAAKQKDITGQSVIDQLAALPEQHGAAGLSKGMSSQEDGKYVNFQVTLKKISNGTVSNITGVGIQ